MMTKAAYASMVRRAKRGQSVNARESLPSAFDPPAPSRLLINVHIEVLSRWSYCCS